MEDRSLVYIFGRSLAVVENELQEGKSRSRENIVRSVTEVQSVGNSD